MAEYYLVPKRLARAVPALGGIARWLEALLLRFCFGLLGLLSPERAAAITAAIFRVLGPHSNKSKAVKRNLRVIYPQHSEEQLEALSRDLFGYLGVAAAELICLRKIWQQRDQRIEFTISAAAQAHLDSGDATVFVTAHVGAWQLTNLISLHQGLTITTVYAAESNPALHSLFLQLRDAFGVKLLPSDAGVRPLLRELKQGHSIGLAMDTRLDSGEPIPFFGVDALTNITAARLALRSKASLLPIRAERTAPGCFHIRVYDPIEDHQADADINDRAIEMTADINRHFESWIREAPEQWMCLKRRWPKPGKP